MARGFLVVLERLLVTAISLLLALIVLGLFVRAVRGVPGVSVIPTGTANGTTLVPGDPDGEGASTVPRPRIPAGPCEEEEPVPAQGQVVLRVYYTCGDDPAPTADTFVYRVVPAPANPLVEVLRQVTKGPSRAEGDLGYRSVFSVATSASLAGLDQDAGEITVDFASLPDISVLSTANDAAFFVANLNANVFQFDDIRSVEYRLDGSCAAFWEHLGSLGCRVVARENFEAEMALNRGE